MANTEYPFHPIAAIFPLLSEADMTLLIDDIKAHGLNDPIVLYDGMILDGRNRALACMNADVPPRYTTFAGSPERAIAHVWSTNMRRRHLSSSQCAIAEIKRQEIEAGYAAKVLAIQEEARARQDQTARLPRNASGQLQPVSQLIDSQAQPARNERRTAAIRAVAAQTNRQYIADAEKIVRLHPEFVEAIEQGRKTIPEVKKAIKQATALTQRQAATAAMLNTTSSNFTTHLETLAAQGQTFGCIYADPPWAYDNQATRGSTDNHYVTMAVDEICALPIRELAAEQSHLHLWTTNAFLFECPKIFEAWGFEFKCTFVWVKPQMGMGNYWRNSHELLLLGIKGGLRGQHHGLMSWIEAARGSHSAKPDRVRDLIEQLSPGPFLELFGRNSVPGWTVWGNECLPVNGRLFKEGVAG